MLMPLQEPDATSDDIKGNQFLDLCLFLLLAFLRLCRTGFVCRPSEEPV
jgi:hypothetical protein